MHLQPLRQRTLFLFLGVVPIAWAEGFAPADRMHKIRAAPPPLTELPRIPSPPPPAPFLFFSKRADEERSNTPLPSYHAARPETPVSLATNADDRSRFGSFPPIYDLVDVHNIWLEDPNVDAASSSINHDHVCNVTIKPYGLLKSILKSSQPTYKFPPKPYRDAITLAVNMVARYLYAMPLTVLIHSESDMQNWEGEKKLTFTIQSRAAANPENIPRKGWRAPLCRSGCKVTVKWKRQRDWTTHFWVVKVFDNESKKTSKTRMEMYSYDRDDRWFDAIHAIES